MVRFVVMLATAGLVACSNSGSDGETLGNDGLAELQCLPLPTQPPAPTIRPVNLAAAVDRQIQSIMPPGQSGHFPSAAACPLDNPNCFAPGNPPESYGPHIDDQRLSYWDATLGGPDHLPSGFKPGEFFDTSGATPETVIDFSVDGGDPVDDTVNIYRDAFGVPVVHADTDYGVWYGAGYALAQDRLFLIDAAVALARGTSAETQGTGAYGADVQTRVLTYSEAEYTAMGEALPELAKTALQAHVDGINAWTAEVLADPTQALLPQEFVALNYLPEPISTNDVLALGVLMTRFVASAGGDEMANVQALQALEAQHGETEGRRIFRDLLWVDDEQADVTIPDQRFTNISTPPELRDTVFEAAADFAAALPLELADGPGTGAAQPQTQAAKLDLPEDWQWPVAPELLAAAAENWSDIPDHVSASYMTVLSPDLTADGSTVLINGPQLGYSYPTLLVEVEVHGGGYDARGSTVAGLPVVGIGYGERTVWGLTTGESKTIDSFIVEVNPDNPEEYFHDGVLKPMDCRDETVNYRSTADGVPNVSEPKPGVNADTIRVCRTVHGPVVARATTADGTPLARAVQYAMWGREIETVNGVQQWNRVDSFAEFFDAMSLVTWNENTMYADADGNIAYFHPGLHPWRHPAADQRFPIPGSGEFDHCGQLAFENTPHSVNPERGYLHNWNNKPALGWGEGVGGDASQEPSGADGRNVNWGQVIHAELDGDGLSIDDLVEMDLRIGRIDPRAAALLPSIMACDGGCGLDAEGQALIDILRGWDRQHYNDAIDVTLEPGSTDDADAAGEPDGVRDTAGATIFDAIATAMVDEITVDVVPTDFITRHSRRGNHPYDAGTFHKLVAKILDPSKTSIPVQHDWLAGRDNEQFVADSIALALTRLKATYGDNTAPADYRRIHARSSVCALAQPLVGPCLSMPHTDRGSWLKIVSFTPAP